MSLDKVVSIITGSGQGIGRAYAHAFAREGAHVIVADVNEEKATQVAAEIAAEGGTAHASHVDIGSEESIAGLVSRTVEQFGRIDVLVNNAAIFSSLTMKPFFDISADEWDTVFRINTRGTFLVSREVGKAMREQGSGKIINISSGVVDNGRPNYLHYLSSKSAINGMTRGMATELGEFGITVNTVSPYGIATEVPRETITAEQWTGIVAGQALHVKGTSDSMVGAVVFLASAAADFITGQTIHVNGGTLYH